MTTASICTIGDEILIGQIVDTNSSGIAKALNNIGIQVSDMHSVGDRHDEIVGSLTALLSDHDIVITTGASAPQRTTSPKPLSQNSLVQRLTSFTKVRTRR